MSTVWSRCQFLRVWPDWERKRMCWHFVKYGLVRVCDSQLHLSLNGASLAWSQHFSGEGWVDHIITVQHLSWHWSRSAEPEHEHELLLLQIVAAERKKVKYIVGDGQKIVSENYFSFPPALFVIRSLFALCLRSSVQQFGFTYISFHASELLMRFWSLMRCSAGLTAATWWLFKGFNTYWMSS